jgi:hypothetical protein
MEMFKVRIVNSGLVGEPFHYCFQNQETNQKIEFSQITHIVNSEGRFDVDIEDSSLDDTHISNVLNNYGHVIDIQSTEDGGYELIFQ